MTMWLCRIGCVVNPAGMAYFAWGHDVFWLAWTSGSFVLCGLAVLGELLVHDATERLVIRLRSPYNS